MCSESPCETARHAVFDIGSRELEWLYSQFLWKEHSVQKIDRKVMACAESVYQAMLCKEYTQRYELEKDFKQIDASMALFRRQLDKLNNLVDHFKLVFYREHGTGDIAESKTAYVNIVDNVVSNYNAQYSKICDDVNAMKIFAETNIKPALAAYGPSDSDSPYDE